MHSYTIYNMVFHRMIPLTPWNGLGSVHSPITQATATVQVRGVAVVLGDVSPTAGVSSAASSQTPVTQVITSGEAMINRYGRGITVLLRTT